MTDGYISDKEQIEAIKRWWQKHGRFIAIAIAIGLLIGFAWRSWHQHLQKRNLQASRIYQSVSQASQKNDLKAVVAGTQALTNKYSKTVYAGLSSLLCAKAHVEAKQNQKALGNLQWVIDHAKAARIKQVASILAARIWVAEKNPKKALSSLSVVYDKSFDPLINWARGDAYSAMKNNEKAHHYYQLAKTGLAASPPAVALLNMKLATSN